MKDALTIQLERLTRCPVQTMTLNESMRLAKWSLAFWLTMTRFHGEIEAKARQSVMAARNPDEMVRRRALYDEAHRQVVFCDRRYERERVRLASFTAR